MRYTDYSNTKGDNMQFTPTVNKVLNDLKMMYPAQANVLDELCITCFMLGERQAINDTLKSMNGTIPEEANLYAEMSAEVL